MLAGTRANSVIQRSEDGKFERVSVMVLVLSVKVLVVQCSRGEFCNR